jgi:hypothetical protein
MSAIVAAAARMERARLYTTTGIAGMMGAAGRAIVDASNAAGAGRVVAMRLADCGCVEVTRGDGTTRTDPFMPWKCDPRPCAWPRPFARGADR